MTTTAYFKPALTHTHSYKVISDNKPSHSSYAYTHRHRHRHRHTHTHNPKHHVHTTHTHTHTHRKRERSAYSNLYANTRTCTLKDIFPSHRPNKSHRARKSNLEHLQNMSIKT